MTGSAGALAIGTLVLVLIIAAIQFLRHNMDPKGLNATKSVAKDESSAHTGVRGSDKPGHMS